MSILGSIISSVLGGRAQPAPPPPTTAPSGEERRASAPIVAPHAPARTAAPSPSPTHTEQPPRAPIPTPTPAHAAAAAQQVDVAAVLDKLAKEAGAKLDWRTSIVDLMKLVKLDSGLAARKALAKELSYTGDTKDSAAMNRWLHKQVMAKLAQNGGKLPHDLKPDLKPDKPEAMH
jgi:Domain of unknown function (DUF3597)